MRSEDTCVTAREVNPAALLLCLAGCCPCSGPLPSFQRLHAPALGVPILSAPIWLKLRSCHGDCVIFAMPALSQMETEAEVPGGRAGRAPSSAERSLSGQVSPESKATEAKSDLSICWHHPDYKPARPAMGWIVGFNAGMNLVPSSPARKRSPAVFPRGLGQSMRGISQHLKGPEQAISPNVSPCSHMQSCPSQLLAAAMVSI